MRLGYLLWTLAMALCVSGLVLVLRYRLIVGGLLIVAALSLGLFGSNELE